MEGGFPGSDGFQNEFKGFMAGSRLALPEGLFIHPNTGQLSYRVTLAEGDSGIHLGLFYSDGIIGKFGLPDGWSLDIPYVIDCCPHGVPDRSLTVNARTYKIDEKWSDVNGHASGLRYINDPKVKFQQIPSHCFPPQPDASRHKLDQPDGSSVDFDLFGMPKKEYKPDGSYIQYTFDSQYGKFLCSIKHSSGQEISMTKDGSRFHVALDGGESTQITFNERGVTSIEHPGNQKTSLVYDGRSISRIYPPTGLSSLLSYTSMGYTHDMITAKRLHVVTDHYLGDGNGRTHRHTKFDLGGLSGGKTYLGNEFSGSEDSRDERVRVVARDRDGLMDSKDKDYLYDVTQSTCENHNVIDQTTTWFNSYHLPVEVIHSKLDGNGGLVNDWKIVYSYDIPEDQGAKATDYGNPGSIEMFDFDGNGNWDARDDLSGPEYCEELDKARSYVW